VNAGANIAAPHHQFNPNAGGNAAVRAQINAGNQNNAVNAAARANAGLNNQVNRLDPRFNNPNINNQNFRNDPRFSNNNIANDPNRPSLNPRHYDPSYNQFRINNRTVNYGNPNYRPSYSRYNWYNGFAAGPYANGGLGGYGNGGAYGVGYRGGFGNNVGTSLLGLGLSALSGGGYGSGLGYPAGWGLGGWGLGSMAYTSGALPYSNPYFSGATGGNYAYNYAQPIPVAIAGNTMD